MLSEKNKRYSVLVTSTLAFTVCFMVWTMLGEIGVPIGEHLKLSGTEYGFLVGTPILTGALIRVPLGIWTDRFGGRIVMTILMLVCVPAIFLVSYATQFWQFILIGLVIGLAGGSFSVGTPYVARWFPKSQQGFAMGIFGAGNAGAALTKYLVPLLIAYSSTWHFVPKAYAVVMLITVFVFWFGSYSKPEHIVPTSTSLRQQLALLKDPGVWRYSQYYSVVFGGYVGLTLWMTNYYVHEYNLAFETAAYLAACFSLPGGVLRALGGYLSDKFGAYRITWIVMWVCWVCFFLLSYPRTHLNIQTVNGNPLILDIHLNVIIFTILMFTVSVAMAVGKASVFKFVANDYPDNIGAVSGIVGLAGGVGGFLLPVLFGMVLDWTGVRSTAFMLLYGTVSISLILMHFSFKNKNLEQQ